MLAIKPRMDRRSAVLKQLPQLRRYARALVGNRDDADDLVQDCLERALRRLKLWRSNENPRRWLFTIMHNIRIDNLRSAARAPKVLPIDSAPSAALGQAASQTDNLIYEDAVIALQKLPDDQRQALLLVGLEGMSYRDAAAILAIPAGTLMSRLSRGRRQLRKLLNENPKRSSELKVVK